MTNADLHAARQTDLNIAFAKSDWREREMMPSDTPRTDEIYKNRVSATCDDLDWLRYAEHGNSKERCERIADAMEWYCHAAIHASELERENNDLRAHAEAETKRADELAAEVERLREMTPVANVTLSGDAEYWKQRAEQAESLLLEANKVIGRLTSDSELAKAEAALAEAREALHKFGTHKRLCAYVDGGFCDCGLHEAKERK